jgi:glycine C-acetyltransferase
VKRGVYVIAFSYPVVPKGRARIRCQMSAALTKDEVTRAVEAFAEARSSSSISQA